MSYPTPAMSEFISQHYPNWNLAGCESERGLTSASYALDIPSSSPFELYIIHITDDGSGPVLSRQYLLKDYIENILGGLDEGIYTQYEAWLSMGRPAEDDPAWITTQQLM